MDFRDTSLDVRGSYAAKFVGLILVTLLLTGTVGAVIHSTVESEIRSDTRQSLQTNAGLEAEELDNWFVLTSRQMETLPRSVAFRSGDSFHASDQLTPVAARDAISGVYFVNVSTRATLATAGSGSVLTDDDRLRPDVHERATGLLESTDGQVVYSDPFRDPATDKPSLLILSRTPSRADRAVLAVVDLRKLSLQVLGSDAGSSEREVTVVNREGTVVLSRDESELLTEDAIAPGQYENGTGTFTTESNHGERLAVGYAASDEHDWITTRRVPTETAYALESAVSAQILGLLAVLVTGLGIIGLTLGRNTIRSVRDLSERAQALQEGDLQTPIESDRRDEFGDLYAAFDGMRESLRERLSEVEHAQRRAEVARDEVLETNAYLEEKAEAYSETMERAAAGDLTERMETDGRNAQMDAIATDFNEMLAELEKTVGQLKTFADTVEESGEVVGASAANVRDAAEQVATSIQKISDDASTHHGDVKTAAQSIRAGGEALDAGEVGAARDRLEHVVDALETVADGADQTMAETQTVAAAAEEQAAELNEVSARADELLRYVAPLSEVLGRFETEAEHEFVFASGPGNRAGPGDD